MAVAIIVIAVVIAVGAIIWGMNRRAGNPEEIERIIQAGVVGGGVKTPPASSVGGAAPTQTAPGGPPPAPARR